MHFLLHRAAPFERSVEAKWHIRRTMMNCPWVSEAGCMRMEVWHALCHSQRDVERNEAYVNQVWR